MDELTSVLGVATVKRTEAQGRAQVKVTSEGGKRSRRELLIELRWLVQSVKKALKSGIWLGTQDANRLLDEFIKADDETINFQQLEDWWKNLEGCAKSWNAGSGCKKQDKKLD
ncbi:hypothetical protein [Candidatus Mycoplasma haematohominis]|uniref:Uncharacterized protein n=1 Tax=Candidatus Mycoplasma haematohominis TaxID=1494318 RepID=A0A478FQE9_9MOLU|nr:hypothetical protein [Candidatus Mycoplasma haemohominis]GCE63134.1 hypothetical protein MHSWG343_01120 [Candidatus Mycoplasma haemohominis]